MVTCDWKYNYFEIIFNFEIISLFFSHVTADFSAAEITSIFLATVNMLENIHDS